MGVISYILKRSAWLALVVLAVSVFAFLIVHMTGDPAVALAGPFATYEDIEAIRVKYGLDKPLAEQYFMWLYNVFRGDLGTSTVSRAPVLREIIPRWTNTLLLAAASNIIATFLGLALGIIAAMRGRIIDSISRLISVIGISIPLFVMGLLLVYFFAVNLRWFPTSGTGTLASYVLPSFTLGIYYAALVSRTTRSQMRDILDSEYIKTARAMGLSRIKIVFKYSLRNALIPLITVIGLQLGYAIGGAVVVEAVFRWPGLGSLLVNSILTKDFPVIQAALLFYAATIALINVIIDLIYAVVDPRIRK